MIKIDTNMWRDIGVGALVAAFAASMLILYEPHEKRPTFWSAVGRVGIAMIASMVVSALASDIFKLTPKVTFALAGASGILGIRIFVGLARYAKRFGISFDDPDEKEWGGAGEDKATPKRKDDVRLKELIKEEAKEGEKEDGPK